MSIEDVEDVKLVLEGYEWWRKRKLHEIENGPDNQLSVSAYIDDYAKMRALDILQQVEQVFRNPGNYNSDADSVELIREILGVD